jgi:hypothetical protein
MREQEISTWFTYVCSRLYFQITNASLSESGNCCSVASLALIQKGPSAAILNLVLLLQITPQRAVGDG